MAKFLFLIKLVFYLQDSPGKIWCLLVHFFNCQVINIGKFAEFNDEFKAILNHHAPIKQSKLCGNTKPHINKTLRKEIMKRSRLKNKANKSGKEGDKRLYNIQRNKVSKLNSKLKKTF